MGIPKSKNGWKAAPLRPFLGTRFSGGIPVLHRETRMSSGCRKGPQGSSSKIPAAKAQKIRWGAFLVCLRGEASPAGGTLRKLLCLGQKVFFFRQQSSILSQHQIFPGVFGFSRSSQ